MTTGFGPKTAWVAVPSISAEELAAALGIAQLEPADWDFGVALAYERSKSGAANERVFITPPLRGWTLCFGDALFEDRKGFAADLSRRLGGREVQRFATHRVSEEHFWERAIGGKTVRYGRSVDGELLTEGELTPEESACGFKVNLSDAELAELGDEAWDDYWWPDEDFVLALAGAWSIDPILVEEEFPDAAPGFIGRIVPPPPAAEPEPQPLTSGPPPRQNWFRRVWTALAGG
jgi:hypothetical protein